MRANRIVQTGAKSQLGGENVGLLMPENQVGIAGVVKREPIAPADSQMAIAKSILPIFFVFMTNY